MAKRSRFLDAFDEASEQSSNDETFKKISAALKATPSGKNLKIKLNTNKKGWSDSRIIEDAVREALGDSLQRGRTPDVLFGNIPIEVKHKTSSFNGLPTDSYGLTRTPNKWYLFVKGPIDKVPDQEMEAWLMRSDVLYDQMVPLLSTSGQISLFTGVADSSIDPSSPKALEQIKKEIESISDELSSAILRKAQGDYREKQGEKMSLNRKIGLQRVRFDVKFESLLRKTISETLKD
jgi:hypothetical protein